MSEHVEREAADPTDVPVDRTGGPDPEPPVEHTGHPVVDEVLRAMEGLQQRPVEEHVAIFEEAHEKLRAALSDAGERPNGPQAR